MFPSAGYNWSGPARRIGDTQPLMAIDGGPKLHPGVIEKYQKARKPARKAVAVAKSTHYGDFYGKLESRERYLYRVAKNRRCQTEQIEKFFGINDKDGHLLTDRKKALQRWRDYIEEISTMEVPHPAITLLVQSTSIPIWKKKGSPADCSNYCPIRLLSHSMKIFERILDRRIREIVKHRPCGFVSGCGTIDAIHAARLLVEKHRERQKSEHIAFLDLEKAFDRVPPGISMEFPISVGVHQGSALSPLLFVVVMDAITRDLQNPVPWTLLYADDVMLASEDKGELEREVQAWCDRLERFGLKLSVKKREYLTTDG
ncbi:unnamed protein product [Heligmosomoides polygyrus]|uniref:Reverse transcriptase domain-containing protein n=1 Tax=Heligmosomoides polygyrus TaxID=6339 RepID=A0A183GPY7_HELPZ|nr:unnamed protein product [Heligmosomoides polygyrus]